LATAPKLPVRFLAAVANSPGGYGTLTNTGLKEDHVSIIYSQGTYNANYEEPRANLIKGRQ
jgi:hypothetical protein